MSLSIVFFIWSLRWYLSFFLYNLCLSFISFPRPPPRTFSPRPRSPLVYYLAGPHPPLFPPRLWAQPGPWSTQKLSTRPGVAPSAAYKNHCTILTTLFVRLSPVLVPTPSGLPTSSPRQSCHHFCHCLNHDGSMLFLSSCALNLP